ncbi:MAG TPA: hypothetical protein VLV86_15385 [Vicinamibacterales bacterium]|nr:hypothetical protein [Vicinamibacterales bacterium]
MNVHEIRRYQMLTRVRDFGTAHRHLFRTLPLAGRMFAAAADAVSAVDAQATLHESFRRWARQQTIAKAAAREALLGHLRAVRRTGRALSLDGHGFGAKFQLPRKPTDRMLAVAARAVLEHAAPLEAEFAAYALPLSGFRAAIDHFEATVLRRHTVVGAHVAARVGIEQAVSTGFSAVRRLDALVLNHLGRDADVVAAWRCARRVARAPVRAADRPIRRFGDCVNAIDHQITSPHRQIAECPDSHGDARALARDALPAAVA